MSLFGVGVCVFEINNSYSMKKYIIVLVSLCFAVIMVWCTSDTTTDTTQTIAFSNYNMKIDTWYLLWNKDAVIDNRIAKKVLAVYYRQNSTLSFSDNIIISQDTLTPRASLEDYVQAAIWGISYTWWKYESIDFQKWTLVCSTTTIPTIMNTFSIYRTPVNSTPETLYFVQYFIHRDDEVIVVSASTNDQDTVSSLQTTLQTLSCSTS